MSEQPTNNRDRIDGLIADAGQSMAELGASRRDICNEHNERIRKLRDLTVSLYAERAKGADVMFDVEATINPELKRLLQDPTHDL